MLYPEWKGEADSAAGTAVFQVNGKRYRIRLESFAAFQEVCEVIKESFARGQYLTAQSISGKVGRSLEEVKQAFGC